MRRIIVILLAGFAMVSCGKGVKIKGHVVGLSTQDTVYLQAVLASGQTTIDSVATEDGKFTFRFKLPDGQSGIYNIKGNGYLIPLVLTPGETVTVKGFGNVSLNYTVEGSAGSAQMHELSMILNNGAAKLDSITNIYTRLDPADTLRRSVTRQYARAYYDTKREQIRFIVSNAGSLASLYALYQRLPNDEVLFNGPQSDVVYYRLVADSLEARDPSSPYLASLRSELGKMDLESLLSNPDALNTITYPDLNMPDMYGRKHKLSDIKGKVILVDFWSASSQQSRLLNAELKELYDRLHDQGLEIYQVSADVDKAVWVSIVQEQKLPWITTCDFLGTSSPAVRAYNVSAIPTNFLIDRQGQIVGKNFYGKELESKLKSVL